MDEQLKSNLKLISFIFFLILCIWLIKMLFPVITLLIIALLIVYLLAPLVNFLANFHIPQPVAAVLVFILFILLILLLFYLIPPVIFREIRQLASYIATDFRQYIALFFAEMEQLDLLYELDLSQTITSAIISAIESIPFFLIRWLNRVSTFNIPFLSELWSLAGLFFLVFFLLLDLDRIKATIVKLFPPGYHNEVLHVISVIDAKVGAYLRGNVVRCSLVGIITGVGLSILGMPFAILLGITAGLLNIIHNIGPFLAAIPAVLLSLTPGTPHPLLIIVLYLIIQTIDPFVLTPLLLGKAVDLRPITVVVAVLCGATLMGVLGLILAIPVTAIAKVLLNHYYVKNLGIEIVEEAPLEETAENKKKILDST